MRLDSQEVALCVLAIENWLAAASQSADEDTFDPNDRHMYARLLLPRLQRESERFDLLAGTLKDGRLLREALLMAEPRLGRPAVELATRLADS